MLQPVMNMLINQRNILASSSPRRIQLLKNIRFPFEIIPSTYEENLDPSKFEHPYDFVIETAKQKALEVTQRLQKDKTKCPDLVIGADTVVALGSEIFGKPKDRDDAIRMLTRFSDNMHQVYTGVVLLRPACRESNLHSFYEVTEVFMAKLSAEIIQSYVDTGEPFDKAGGYGIQELGGTFVERIRGDYFNVTGFPLHKFCTEIYDMYSKS